MKRLPLLCLLAFSLGFVAQADGAAVPDVTGLDMRPWLLLQAAGADIAGGALQGEVFLYRGGLVILEYTAQTGNGRTVRRGVASPAAGQALREALGRAHFGRTVGNCGQPAPDAIERYGLLSFSNAGGAPRSRSFGGNFQSCPLELREGFDAICTYIWKTVGPSPEVCSPSEF